MIFASITMIYTIDLILMPIVFKGIKLDVVDVGQGLFINLNYDDYNLVFDAGSNSDNIGKYVTVPYLLKHGRNKVDGIFISHFHEDHYSGINDIIKNCRVESVFTSSDNGKELINKDYIVLNSNQSFNLGNKVKIEILWPDKQYLSTNENNMSNVYLIECDKTKILITGDIEREVEELILDRLVDVDIVIAPHHGSNTSSSKQMLDIIKPEISILSYGKNNYGIPGQEVIERYDNIGSKVLSTFIDGEINIVVINNKIYYNTYTGKHSENMSDIYSYNIILDLVVFAILMLFTCFYRKYIVDKENYNQFY